MKKELVLWTKVNERISNAQFRRIFRMTRELFGLLYQLIISSIGESKFLSKSYINTFLKCKDIMYDANVCITGGYTGSETRCNTPITWR